MPFLIAWPVVMTLVYALVPPPVSNIMLLRALGGAGIDKAMGESRQDFAATCPRRDHLRRCPLLRAQGGVDWREFQGVIEDALDKDEGPQRGASTIPMQTAKNLFLWDGRFAVRKVIELPMALWMDFVWSKRRMIEIYLNIVEWAPGVYGAEAAARHHFKKSAKNLTKRNPRCWRQFCRIPIKRNAGKPSKGVSAIANRILLRMREWSPISLALSLERRL
jgi:monofunctional glycosyltransferase